ncbi:MAG: MBG domain-containing protein, partial [Clostridiales bacterium]|nr:MBG domain-containing protein [Clostridiales bacterium]
MRWGLNTATYTGSELGMTVLPEGLIGSDKVTLNITYKDENGNTVTPKEVGTYSVLVTLDDANYKLSSTCENTFTIVEKKVDAVWSGTSFVYDGEEHEITAHFMDGDTEVELIVTVEDTVNAGSYTATAALPEGYTNYKLTKNTETITYIIEKAGIKAVWDDDIGFKFDGNEKEVEVTLEGLNETDLSADVEYTYYDAEGNKLTSLPVDAGEYKVVISIKENSEADSNYKLIDTTEKTFTIEKANLKVTLDTNEDDECKYEYDGEGKSPIASVADEYDTPLAETAHKITYAPADEEGNAKGEFVEEAPKNVGKYIVKVEVDALNVEQNEYT